MTRFGIEALQERVKAAVDAEGMRPFARRAGVGLGVVRSMIEGRDSSFSNVIAVSNALRMELGFGIEGPSPLQTLNVDGSDYTHIPLHDALLAAGSGACNGTEEVIENLAFRKDWLKRIGVSASAARLARVQGDSMQPSLWHGDMILIDGRSNAPPERAKDQRDQRRSPIFALLDNGEARVKRIQRISEDTLMLLSDNTDYQPELRQGKALSDLRVIGKVVWWGHTSKE